MHRACFLHATAGVAVLILPLAAQSKAASSVTTPVASTLTERCALTGRILLPSGAPAAGAVVVTSVGEQAASAQDGTFALDIDVARGARSVQLTALSGNDLSATKRVALSPWGRTDTGTIVLAVTTSCEPSWLPTFGQLQTPNGEVKAFTVFDDGSGPALFLGGDFNFVGAVVANHIAKWNGSTWEPLGTGTNGSVYALAVFDDGSGPALYAGGVFYVAGGLTAINIAKWNGASWSPLGSGVSGRIATNVSALEVFDDGSGPALYAAGIFETAGGIAASNIARWNGTTWSPVGLGISGFVTGPAWVNALEVFDDGTGPALYVGGHFPAAAGIPANNIAKWNGATWAPLGSGTDRDVYALTGFDDGTGPALYAAGIFANAGGVVTGNIAKWNGASWSPLGGLGMNNIVFGLAVFDDGSGPALFAGGYFSNAGGAMASGIAKWDGTRWSPLASGINSPDVRALAVFDDGNGAALFAGGYFYSAGSIGPTNITLNIAQWRGAAWAPLGRGLDATVRALTVWDDGSGPALYAGGDFTTAGGVAASRIAKWRGQWSPLASGSTSPVYALTVFDDGGGSALYAGGLFKPVPGAGLDYIAQWNGSSWALLGSALNSTVYALTVFDDGSGPALCAGGAFTTAGGVTASHIAKWNGSSWAPFGSGMDGTFGYVRALAVFDDGSGPALFAGGDFTTAGGVTVNYIAKWNGTSWSPLGSGVNGNVHALAVFDDGGGPALFAGGFFTNAGGTAANDIAKWNGSSWTPLGSGMNQSVEALTVFDDGSGPALYASGNFTSAGGVAASHIAKWNGTSWAPLGGGLLFDIRALTGFDDGSGPALCAGGDFVLSSSGDSYLAKWGCTLPAGARTFGASSPGCTGALALGVTSSPKIGNAAFAITCTNAPPSAPGAFLAGTALATPVPIQGVQIWVNPILAPIFGSDPSGHAAVPLAIPPSPVFIGAQFDVQLVFLGPNTPPPCPPRAWSASNALEITIQP